MYVLKRPKEQHRDIPVVAVRFLFARSRADVSLLYRRRTTSFWIQFRNYVACRMFGSCMTIWLFKRIVNENVENILNFLLQFMSILLFNFINFGWIYFYFESIIKSHGLNDVFVILDEKVVITGYTSSLIVYFDIPVILSRLAHFLYFQYCFVTINYVLFL